MSKSELKRHCAMGKYKELEYPVLDGILTEFIVQGAKIKKQDGQWHLFAKDGEGLAEGETISKMLMNLIFRHG
jgi:hypothetical protein